MIFDIKTSNTAKPPKPVRSWLLSFIDLLSLILVFFVMIYATRDISSQQYVEIKDSFMQYINGKADKQKVNFVNTAGKTIIIKSSTTLNYIETLLKNLNRDNPSLNATFVNNGKQIIIEFGESAETPSQLAEKIDGRLILLSGIIAPLSNQLEVVSHAGNAAKSITASNLVAQRLEVLGHEYKILRTLPTKNIISETVDKNKNTAKIQIIINRYESVL